jgi:hypothetical protein
LPTSPPATARTAWADHERRRVGRELGDSGGPLLVGAIATTATLGAGFLGLAALLAVARMVAAAPAYRIADE